MSSFLIVCLLCPHLSVFPLVSQTFPQTSECSLECALVLHVCTCRRDDAEGGLAVDPRSGGDLEAAVGTAEDHGDGHSTSGETGCLGSMWRPTPLWVTVNIQKKGRARSHSHIDCTQERQMARPIHTGEHEVSTVQTFVRDRWIAKCSVAFNSMVFQSSRFLRAHKVGFDLAQVIGSSSSSSFSSSFA